MSKIVWDAAGQHWYQTGIDKVALYKFDGTRYGKPIAWNGVTAVNESPSGAESNKIYADNIPYLNLISAEEFALTLEAYQSPEEFDECDGEAFVTSGVLSGIKVKAHAARRVKFAIAWRVLKGNDNDAADINIASGATNGFVYHIAYGCTAAPSSRDNGTVNDSPEAVTLSWEINTLPIADASQIGAALLAEGVTKVAHLEFEAKTQEEAEAIENLLYDANEYCPMPVDLTGAAGTYYKVIYDTEDTSKGTVSGTVVSGDKVPSGTEVTLEATPKTGYTFTGWFAPGASEPASTSASYTISSVTENKYLVAVFSNG